jgi:hypothetical protein
MFKMWNVSWESAKGQPRDIALMTPSLNFTRKGCWRALELIAYRYLVAVSERELPNAVGDYPNGGGVVYRHIKHRGRPFNTVEGRQNLEPPPLGSPDVRADLVGCDGLIERGGSD